jgi:hypothetical protein
MRTLVMATAVIKDVFSISTTSAAASPIIPIKIRIIGTTDITWTSVGRGWGI